MNLSKLGLLAMIALALAACKKDEEETPAPSPTPAPTTGTVKLGFSFTHGTNAFDLSNTYQDGAGNNVRFDKVKFYASNFHLSDDAGAEVGHFHDTYLLLDASASSNEFTLGAINPAHLHEVEFTLGLDSETNHADPTVAAAPLNIPEMHWSWNPTAGYKFLNMEGHVDTNADGDFDDATDGVFTYHCATDAMARTAMVMAHGDVTAGGNVTIQATVNMAVVLQSMNVVTNATAMGGGPANAAAMDALANAISGM
ncbi:MAG: MbnP family protein [Flavobacteriales bacterium]